MAISVSKNVEPSKYRWEPVSDASGSVQRRGNGTENLVGLQKENAKGQYDFHILVKTELHQSTSLASLKKRLIPGLMKQRFQHPNIACRALWDNQSNLLIRYTPLINDLEAVRWAQESIELRATPQSGHDIRREIVTQRKVIDKSSRSFTVYMLGNVANEDESLPSGSELEFLIHFNHIFWDGISARQFVGNVLRDLGHIDEHTQYEWGKEVKHLSMPLLDTLKIDTETLGNDYGDSLEEFLTSMFAIGSSHAIQIGTVPGLPATAVLQIPLAECQSVIQGVKTRLGPGYTITNLAQAAILLALLKTNPLSQEDSTKSSVVMPLPVNGRRYLREEFADNQYGSCQACAVVVFDRLEQFAIDFEDKDAVLNALVKGMEITRSSYDYWLNKPFLLPLGLAKDNFISPMLESYESESDGKAKPASLPKLAIAKISHVADMSCHQIFASDGVNDLYIPQTISSSDGSPLMILLLTDAYQPAIFLRMEGWKGTTTLSLGYSDVSYSSKEADGFLQCVKGFMMAIAA